MHRIAALIACSACWTGEPAPVTAPAAPTAPLAVRDEPAPPPATTPPLPDEATALATCNAAALVELGHFDVGHGDHARALRLFDHAFTCVPDSQVAVFAYAAACNARNEIQAKKYFALLAAHKQPTYAQICVRNGIMLP
jgi:hypothetical protein